MDEEGEQLGVMPTRDALTMAEERSLDLVEVAPAYDVGEVTSLAGASLLLDYFCLLASRRK